MTNLQRTYARALARAWLERRDPAAVVAWARARWSDETTLRMIAGGLYHDDRGRRLYAKGNWGIGGK